MDGGEPSEGGFYAKEFPALAQGYRRKSLLSPSPFMGCDSVSHIERKFYISPRKLQLYIEIDGGEPSKGGFMPGNFQGYLAPKSLLRGVMLFHHVHTETVRN